METQNEHLSLLTNLLTQYRLLNSLYEQIADSSVLSFENQIDITDFYHKFKDKEAFEKVILHLLLSADKEKLAPVITNLRIETNKNIDIYQNHKELFDGIDTLKVCMGRHEPLRIEIEGQLKDTNKIWQELTQVRNSLESASWNNNNIAIQRLTSEEQKFENQYKEEQKKLDKLYQQQKEADKTASRYINNAFRDIFKLSNFFSSLLNNYFPVEKENMLVAEIIAEERTTIQETQSQVEPDMIFRTKMYEKFLSLEQKLIRDKYLSEDLQCYPRSPN
ncbi:hypothetical protein AGMMS50262_19180 [Bacteroidia bacterium]|nr:hypothetical protein AGMMS50262_19180 [Bacteroidia bacterium]